MEHFSINTIVKFSRNIVKQNHILEDQSTIHTEWKKKITYAIISLFHVMNLKTSDIQI